MPNIKGPEAGRPLRLMPWQRFVFANLFGFVERGTATRRFRQAVVYVPRGNGKTTLAAPIGLYLTFVEGEGGAEGYAAAVTRDQARILFEAAQNMVRRSPGFRAAFGVGVGANAIHQERTGLPLRAGVLRRQGAGRAQRAGGGLRRGRLAQDPGGLRRAAHRHGQAPAPAAAVHQHRHRQQRRHRQQLWDYAARVLDGAQEDERLFALVHAADPEDDPWDEANVDQGQPELGPSRPAGRHPRHHAPGQEQPAQEAAAKTRHLNLWVGATRRCSPCGRGRRARTER
jgi:phage terminase large subunit-like protein